MLRFINKYKLIWVVFSSLGLIGCNSKSLENDPVIESVFAKDEITELRYILDFMDNMVKTRSAESNIQLTYKKYLTVLNDVWSRQSDSVYYYIGFAQEVEFLDKVKSFSVFDEIYEYYIPPKVYSQDTTLTNLDPEFRTQTRFRYDGKYPKFLEQCSKFDSTFQIIHESFILAGTVSPKTYSLMIGNPDLFDFRKDRVRLIYAICLLGWGENVDYQID